MKDVERRSVGFTLIELLVVIAIIAILSAILFPVFAKAREKGREAACASNMKQLGLGILQYEQDYDEMMPNCSVFDATHGNWEDYTWREMIYTYVKSTQVYVCPSNTNTGLEYLSDWVTNTHTYQGIGELSDDYLCNFNYARNNNKPGQNNGDGPFGPQLQPGAGSYAPVNASQIASPASTINLIENASAASNALNSFDVTNIGFANCLWSNHERMTNYEFNDGHVKALYPSQTLSIADGGAQASNYWTRDSVSFTDQTTNNQYNSSDIVNARTILTDAMNTFQ